MFQALGSDMLPQIPGKSLNILPRYPSEFPNTFPYLHFGEKSLVHLSVIAAVVADIFRQLIRYFLAVLSSIRCPESGVYSRLATGSANIAGNQGYIYGFHRKRHP
jgi:hypothetical protein